MFKSFDRFESGSLADFALGGSPSGGAVVLNSTTWWPLVSLRSLFSDNLFEVSYFDL